MIEAALSLAGRALEAFGLPAETVRDRLAQERDDEYARADGKGERKRPGVAARPDPFRVSG